jgi:hypothetical protein
MVGKDAYEEMLHIVSIIFTRVVIYVVPWIQA